MTVEPKIKISAAVFRNWAVENSCEGGLLGNGSTVSYVFMFFTRIPYPGWAYNPVALCSQRPFLPGDGRLFPVLRPKAKRGDEARHVKRQQRRKISR